MPKLRPPVQAGFDYIQAIRKLNRAGISYDELAHCCGFRGKSAITKINNGAIPSHTAGEALYILYIETFGEKPV